MKRHITKAIRQIQGYPHYARIESKTRELAERMGYEPHDLDYLTLALCRTRIDEDNCYNDALATLGDSVLKMVLSEYFYLLGFDKSDITDAKRELENNAYLKKMAYERGWFRYLYNQYGFVGEVAGHRQVNIGGKHPTCIEAIIGAIFLDRKLRYVRKWIYTQFGLKGETKCNL